MQSDTRTESTGTALRLSSSSKILRLFSCFAPSSIFFFFQAADGIRDDLVTGVQTCALPISINDVLTTALKYTVKSSPQAARLIALIEKELHEAKVSATLSGVPSNVYRDAFAAASGNVSKWREVPPPVDH